jgi:uncharacterized membrane protein HdeD (DUF308 family)
LGLWSLTFGGAKTGNFWFDVARNALALILGVLILLTPVLSAIGIAFLLVNLFAIQALIVGVLEIVVAVRERALYSKIWPILLSGAAYVVFGVALIFWPLMGALAFTVLAGVLMIVFAVALLGFAWRLYKGADAAP